MLESDNNKSAQEDQDEIGIGWDDEEEGDEGPEAEPTPAQSIIGPVDDRKLVSTPMNSPWRRICSLQIQAATGTGVGTGWLAGPRTVITAGHCVNSDRMGGWATSIEVMPGRSDHHVPHSVTSSDFASVSNWTKHRLPGFDIGVIQLNEPLGDEVGWFGFSARPDSAILNKTVRVAGYPYEQGGRLMYEDSGTVVATDRRRLYYTADTMGGTSGGPIFVETPGKQPVVVGIHAYGEEGVPDGFTMEANSAPRIDPDVFKQIKAWIASA